jgi:transcriptional/translational regulatory protein YebC/TACO1
VVTGPYDFVAVKEALAKAGLRSDFAEVTMKPLTEVAIGGDDAVRMQKLLDAVESLDDVQDVYTNALLDT